MGGDEESEAMASGSYISHRDESSDTAEAVE
jgi:hypothetical protein